MQVWSHTHDLIDKLAYAYETECAAAQQFREKAVRLAFHVQSRTADLNNILLSSDLDFRCRTVVVLHAVHRATRCFANSSKNPKRSKLPFKQRL